MRGRSGAEGAAGPQGAGGRACRPPRGPQLSLDMDHHAIELRQVVGVGRRPTAHWPSAAAVAVAPRSRESHTPPPPLALRRSGNTDIAERNEEINRRRLARPGASGGPLRVTDPAALQRLMAEMRAKAEQQKWVLGLLETRAASVGSKSRGCGGCLAESSSERCAWPCSSRQCPGEHRLILSLQHCWALPHCTTVDLLLGDSSCVWQLYCRAAEEAREAERKAREGDAYRTPEQRAEAARAARAAAAEASKAALKMHKSGAVTIATQGIGVGSEWHANSNHRLCVSLPSLAPAGRPGWRGGARSGEAV